MTDSRLNRRTFVGGMAMASVGLSSATESSGASTKAILKSSGLVLKHAKEGADALKKSQESAKKMKEAGKSLSDLQKFTSSMKGLSKLSMGLGALSAGFGAGMAIAEMFGAFGPSPNKQILDGINRIEGKIDALQTTMLARFDDLERRVKDAANIAVAKGQISKHLGDLTALFGTLDAYTKLLREKVPTDQANRRLHFRRINSYEETLLDTKNEPSRIKAHIQHIHDQVLGLRAHIPIMKLYYENRHGDLALISEFADEALRYVVFGAHAYVVIKAITARRGKSNSLVNTMDVEKKITHKGGLSGPKGEFDPTAMQVIVEEAQKESWQFYNPIVSEFEKYKTACIDRVAKHADAFLREYIRTPLIGFSRVDKYAAVAGLLGEKYFWGDWLVVFDGGFFARTGDRVAGRTYDMAPTRSTHRYRQVRLAPVAAGTPSAVYLSRSFGNDVGLPGAPVISGTFVMVPGKYKTEFQTQPWLPKPNFQWKPLAKAVIGHGYWPGNRPSFPGANVNANSNARQYNRTLVDQMKVDGCVSLEYYRYKRRYHTYQTVIGGRSTTVGKLLHGSESPTVSYGPGHTCKLVRSRQPGLPTFHCPVCVGKVSDPVVKGEVLVYTTNRKRLSVSWKYRMILMFQ